MTKFYVLVYNPQYVNPDLLGNLKDEIERDFKVKVYTITHHHKDKLPLYLMNSEGTVLVG